MAWPKTLILAMLFASAGLSSAASLFCCQDASGRKVCGDIVPEQCKGRGYQVIDTVQGTVLRDVPPPMTPEQRAQKEAEAKRQKEQEEAKREQRRRDAALLEVYPTVQDIDAARARAEDEIGQTIKQANERIDEAMKRRKRYEEEMEFYKKSTPPIEVTRGMRNADDEINAQRTLIDNKQKELTLVRDKYANDKKRYLEIKSGGNTSNIVHPALR